MLKNTSEGTSTKTAKTMTTATIQKMGIIKIAVRTMTMMIIVSPPPCRENNKPLAVE
jgi:hypothetical protein